MTGMFDFLISVSAFVVVISVVVVIHELGHYFAGRYFGAAVESFSVGFGPRLFSIFDKNGTRWQLSLLPIGGFVKFIGESQFGNEKLEMAMHATNTSTIPKGRVYNSLTPAARAVIAVAGPAANFIFATFVFAILIFIRGMPIEHIEVAGVVEGGPAERAGFKVGDIITKAGSKTISNVSDVISQTRTNAGSEVLFIVERGTSTVELVVIPERQIQTNELGMESKVGVVGVELSRRLIEIKKYGPISAIGAGAIETYNTIALITRTLGRIITGKESISQFVGPVGVGDVAGRVVKANLEMESQAVSTQVSSITLSLLALSAMISIGIGFFNLLPLPVLDGGHIVFCAYESIAGKALSAQVQGILLMLGFSTLLCMAIYITFNDLVRAGLLGS